MSVFVDDGPKPVEAFALFMRQGTNGSSQMSSDYLHISGGIDTHTSSEIRSPEHRRGQHNLVAPGDGYRTFFYGRGQELGYPEVKAVIFNDGSTVGDPDYLAAMQASRNGYSDEVNFWVDRLNREDIGTPEWDVLVAEGAAREKVAETKSRQHPNLYRHDGTLEPVPDPANAYWQARYAVARGVSERTISDYQKRLGFGVMRNTFIGWKDKIDSDNAKRSLEASYPLPNSIKAEAETAYSVVMPK